MSNLSSTTAIAAEIAPVGTKLHGEVIAWEISGIKVRYSDLLDALRDSDLDTAVARPKHPRHAFATACRRLEANRVIRLVAETDHLMEFQFTAEHREGERFEYTFETLLRLNKNTGIVSGEMPGLVTHAQELLNDAMAHRTGSDITRIVQRLFERKADLFPIKSSGGMYFVPQRHADFLSKIQGFLGRVRGSMHRFPVPAGIPHGDKSVKETVENGLYDLIEEHRKAVADFTADTREATLERAAEKIRQTKFKILAYAEYLGATKDGLLEQLSEAADELRKKVVGLGSDGAAA